MKRIALLTGVVLVIVLVVTLSPNLSRTGSRKVDREGAEQVLDRAIAFAQAQQAGRLCAMGGAVSLCRRFLSDAGGVRSAPVGRPEIIRSYVLPRDAHSSGGLVLLLSGSDRIGRRYRNEFLVFSAGGNKLVPYNPVFWIDFSIEASSVEATAHAPQISWTTCPATRDTAISCGSVSVPRDHSHPDGSSLSIAIAKLQSTGGPRRRGVLVWNRGGPGLSSVDALQQAGTTAFPAALREAFDIVAFDVRGTGRSSPIHCGDAQAGFWRSNFQEPGAVMAAGTRVARACAGHSDGHSSVEAARDLDIVREALHEKGIAYLGQSYGSFLGLAYAHIFPDRLRALVLDAPVDPESAAATAVLEKAVASERALNRLLSTCSGCGPQVFDEASARLAKQPLRVRHRSIPLTSSELRFATLAALHAEEHDRFARALRELIRGDGNLMGRLADSYTLRYGRASFAPLHYGAFTIRCADRRWPAGRHFSDLMRRARALAPRLGSTISGLDAPCASWKSGPPWPKGAVRAPTLVAAALDDPVTPFAWASRIASRIEGTSLIRVAGSRHGTFSTGNRCVDDAIEAFLLGRIKSPAAC